MGKIFITIGLVATFLLAGACMIIITILLAGDIEQRKEEINNNKK